MSMSNTMGCQGTLRWKESRKDFLGQQHMRNFLRNGATSINPGSIHGRCHIRQRTLSTSALVCINALSRSDHQKDLSFNFNGRSILQESYAVYYVLRFLKVIIEKCFTLITFCHGEKRYTDLALSFRSMDEIYDALVHRLLPTATADQSNAKYIIGLAGPPGAGKSTVANEVVFRLNVLWRQRAYGMNHQIEPTDIAVAVPMDGFHLYRSQLDKMEDPKEAHARRGAPWTFDPARLRSCLSTLRSQGSVYVPSFDHGAGDPVEDDIFVSPLHKIVLVEGNYLLLEDGLWREVVSFFDERWFLEVDIDLAMRRVEKRHISTGKLPKDAKWRVEYNDRKNAELVMRTRKNADFVICSVEAPA